MKTVFVLQRLCSNTDYSLSVLYLGKELICFVLEDEKRNIKVKHETRIPAGYYRIELRKEGGMNEKFSKKFKFHAGMLWIKNISNFEYVYFHPGNTDDDTSGCLLPGFTHTIGKNFISESNLAYEKIYKICLESFDKNIPVFINVVDEFIN